MNQDKMQAVDSVSAGLTKTADAGDAMGLTGVYKATLRNAAGEVLWEDEYHNVVTTLGKNDALDKYLAGSAYTAAFFMGLISSVSYSTGPVSGDTQASHAGWTECGATNAPNYGSATRPAVNFAGAASAGTKTAAGVAFTFSSAGTVKGSSLSTNSTKDGTTGILVSAGLFTGGDKVVAISDVLTVTYSMSA